MPATNSMDAQPYVIAVGQIPPPVTGYAYITARMIETISKAAVVEAINISPGDKSGLVKHIHKAKQTTRACWRIAKNANRPRLVYLGCEGDWGLIYTVALVLISRLFGYKISLHHHSFSYIDKRSWLMALVLSVGGCRLHHVFLCTTMRERFENRYGEVLNARILSNAAFVEPFPESEQVRPPSTEIRIGMLSNLTREKGLYTFIHLLRLLREADFDAKGFLAGPIALEEDKAMVTSAENDFAGALRYVGPLYGNAKSRFYSGIDVFIFPTEYANEAQPAVLFEALAAGNAIIAFDRGCIGSQIGSNGVAVPINENFCERAQEYISELVQNHSDLVLRRQAIARNYEQLRSSELRSAENFVRAWSC